MGSKVFVREATGLVKKASLLDAVSLNIANMSIGEVFLAFPLYTILFSSVDGLNLLYCSIIACALSIPQAIVYTMMCLRIPRTGGDYVWVSRTLGPLVGGTLAFAGTAMMMLAFNALDVLYGVMALGSSTAALGVSFLSKLATPGGAPVLQFSIGALFCVLFIALNIVKPKMGIRLVSALTIFGVVSLIIAFLVLILSGRQAVVNWANSLGSGLSYQSIASAYKGSEFDLSNTMLFTTFFAIYVYPFLFGAPSIASELKGKSAIKWNIPLSYLFVSILVTLGFFVLYHVAGFRFVQAAMSNPTLVNQYSFNLWTLALGISKSVIVSWIIAAGVILWNFAIAGFGFISTPRYFFAQAFDRYLPSLFAYVSPKYGSPVFAHLFDLFVTLGVLGIATLYYNSILFIGYSTLSSIVYFAVVGLSAVVFALKKEKGSAKTTLAVCGALTFSVLVYYTYNLLRYYQIWGGNPFSFAYVATVLTLGALIYFVSKSYHKKRGIDISLAFKEIPPE
jgi:amino acid transporter